MFLLIWHNTDVQILDHLNFIVIFIHVLDIHFWLPVVIKITITITIKRQNAKFELSFMMGREEILSNLKVSDVILGIKHKLLKIQSLKASMPMYCYEH